MVMSACVQPTATPEAIAKTKASGQAALGFWIGGPGRPCLFSQTTLLNTDTREEIVYKIGGRYSDKSTPGSRLSGRDRQMQDVVFMNVSPGAYTIKDVRCNVSTRSVIAHSEASVAEDPSKRLTLTVGAGEVADFGILQIKTANSVGSNAVIIVNSRAIIVPEASTGQRLEAINEVLGPSAGAVVAKTAVRGGPDGEGVK
jgi:hypothetical protein